MKVEDREIDQMVAKMLATGRFDDQRDVLRQALRHLAERDQIRAKLQEQSDQFKANREPADRDISPDLWRKTREVVEELVRLRLLSWARGDDDVVVCVVGRSTLDALQKLQAARTGPDATRDTKDGPDDAGPSSTASDSVEDGFEDDEVSWSDFEAALEEINQQYGDALRRLGE